MDAFDEISELGVRLAKLERAMCGIAEEKIKKETLQREWDGMERRIKLYKEKNINLMEQAVKMEEEKEEIIKFFRNRFGWCVGCRYFASDGTCNNEKIGSCADCGVDNDGYEFEGRNGDERKEEDGQNMELLARRMGGR